MTDKRFRWLLIATSLTIIAVSFIWNYPQAVKANSTKDSKLGEYIYFDDYSIIHVSRKCSRLNYKDMTSTRVKIDDMYFYFKDTPFGNISFCPKCVDDKDYEKIISVLSEQIEFADDDIIRKEKQ